MSISKILFIPCCVLLLISVAVNRNIKFEEGNNSKIWGTKESRSFRWQNIFQTPNFLSKVLWSAEKNQPLCSLSAEIPPLSPAPKEAPKSFQNYISWHRQARACLETPSCKEKPDVIIWRCHVPNHPCAGLGDRLRGIVTTMYLAISARRAFFIDWPTSTHDHFPLVMALIPASIDWQMPKSLVDIKSELPAVFWGTSHDGPEDYLLPSGKDYKPSSENFELETADTSVFYVSSTTTELLIAKVQKNINSTERIKDTRNLSTTIVVRALYKILFRPSAAVTNLADLVYSQDKPSYVSIHSRTGEDVGEANASAFVNMSTHDDVSVSLLKCATKVDPSDDPKIAFLASDSVAFKKVFKKKSSMYGYRVITPNWRALHLRKRPDIMGQVSEESHCREFLNIFVDLVLMSRGKALVSTNSGFSRVAFYFGNSIGHFIGYNQETNESCKLHKYIGLL